jgi:hypothetical protein
MKHPSQADLALLAGGDLGFWSGLYARMHFRTCDRCREEVEAYRGAIAALSQADDMPANLNWNRLEAEMSANIHLGLEAGECVGSLPARNERVGWRAAAVMAGMTLLLVTAWWLNASRRNGDIELRSSRIEIRTTPAGIELNENGNALTLMHRRGGDTPLVVSAPGMLRARYVDEETGQVTINNVYAD